MATFTFTRRNAEYYGLQRLFFGASEPKDGFSIFIHHTMKSPVTEVPEAARVVTMILSLLTIAILSFCLTRRVQKIKEWRSMSLQHIIVLAIYVDSFLFIFCTAILSKAYSLNQSVGICDGAILLFLSYMSTKIMIYYFLVEKCYLIRTRGESRRESKLWLFNFLGVICPYVVLVVLVIVYRIAYLDKKGVCIIGMRRKALVPLIVFDLLLNIWLTCTFLQPLRECYSYKQKKNKALREVVFRTFVGSCVTLVLSITNLTVIGILNGEPGYICLCLCNLDILCTTLVLHWVTSIDKADNKTTTNSSRMQSAGVVQGSTNISRSKAEDFQEFDQMAPDASLTTKVGCCRDTLVDTKLGNAVAVKTQVVQEVEVGSYGSRSDSDSDSQEEAYSGSGV